MYFEEDSRLLITAGKEKSMKVFTIAYNQNLII